VISTEGRGLGIEAAGSWTSAYWASLTLGRVVLGWVADRVGPDRLLRLASLGAVSGVGLLAFDAGTPGRLGLLLLGMSLAPMYPTLMARTPLRVGPKLANHTVGFLVSSAGLGSSLVPWVVGVLVGQYGLTAIGGVTVTFGVALAVLVRFATAPASPR
jgi:fucose permease